MARNQSTNYKQSVQDQKWTKMFKRLQAYQQEHNGSCNVPQKYPPDQQLGSWVQTQRRYYKKGCLANERCDQLESIGFDLTRNREKSDQDRWTKMFHRLQAYQQEHNGSCNVPQKYPPDQKLGIWVYTQRLHYKKGMLAKERLDQLEKIGFEWTRTYEWSEMFKRLQAYQQEHNGSCRVPQAYHPDPKLGMWVKNQRSHYKKGWLAKERLDQLEKIGFKWTRTYEWSEMFKRLQAYQQEHNGSCNVPQGYHPDPKLGIWVRQQRSQYKQGLLTNERIDQLDAIGFEWTVRERPGWTEMVKRLGAYQREHNGSCNVPQKYPQDQALGKWVSNQRRNYKKGLLTKERSDELEAIGFEWTRMQSLQDRWTKMFHRLQAYQQEHNGSCNVPLKYHPDPQLGYWVQVQRKRYKKGLLAKERCDQLEEIGFVWIVRERPNGLKCSRDCKTTTSLPTGTRR